MRRGFIARNSIGFVFIVVSVCCIFIVLISVLRLPDVPLRGRGSGLYQTSRGKRVSKDFSLGTFGEMMVGMLPEDLAFTVFVPSEKAFERDLRLHVNESLTASKENGTYAVISRVLGFSVVPRAIWSGAMVTGEVVSYDSLSGYTLYISKDMDGMLVVNRIRSERIDLVRQNVVVHVMDGVLMDAEFEESVQPDYSQDD